MSTNSNSMDRRDFMKTSAIAAGSVALASGLAHGEVKDGLDYRNHRPDRMTYRKLGKTNFMCSRLVFGCGAALIGGRAVRLLERAYEAGVNHYDVGYDDYYKGSEKNLAAFLKKHRDDVWVTSKAPCMGGMGMGSDEALKSFTVEVAKSNAEYWTQELDKSLSRMEIDYVDAYYLMGIGNPIAVKSDEMYAAFTKAKEAGKVGHYGISTHKRAEACLEAAIECGYHSLAMIAITPGGWYDWDSKELLEGTASMTQIRPVLDRAKEAGIGLVGMKAARFIAPATALGKGDAAALDKFYDPKYLENDLTPFQRSYAYVLENGMDVVNSDMQNFAHFEENLVAAQKSHEYFA